MAAPHALFETQTLQYLAQIVKTDGRVGGTAEKACQRFLSAHRNILHGAIGRLANPGRTTKAENLFPRFTTIRKPVDGKHWFPVYTYADDSSIRVLLR